MITSSEYKKRLSKMRPNIYIDGKLVDREFKRLEGAINILSKTYDIVHDPEFKEYEDVLTATSHLTGQKINRFNHIHRSIADLLAKQKMTRIACHQVGGCIARCMGIDSANALSVATYMAISNSARSISSASRNGSNSSRKTTGAPAAPKPT